MSLLSMAISGLNAVSSQLVGTWNLPFLTFCPLCDDGTVGSCHGLRYLRDAIPNFYRSSPVHSSGRGQAVEEH